MEDRRKIYESVQRDMLNAPNQIVTTLVMGKNLDANKSKKDIQSYGMAMAKEVPELYMVEYLTPNDNVLGYVPSFYSEKGEAEQVAKIVEGKVIKYTDIYKMKELNL